MAAEYDQMHFRPGSAAEYFEKRRLSVIYPYLSGACGMRVLDAGCGTGTYSRMAKDFGAQVVASDISENMIRICKAKGVGNLLVSDYHSPPFREEAFDLALCINAIHYSGSPINAVEEIRRVLSKDGVLILSYFNVLNVRVLNRLRRLYELDHPVRHEHRHGPSLMRDISMTGLRSVYSCGINLLPVPSDSRPWNTRVLHVLSRLESRFKGTPLMHVFNETLAVFEKR